MSQHLYQCFKSFKLQLRQSNQPWDFCGRNDAKAETPVLWPPHAKSWLIGKDSDAGRDRGQEEKRTTEDEMAEWHHQLDGRESEWTLGVGNGQGGLACCDSWDCKELDTTEQLNLTELIMNVAACHKTNVTKQCLPWPHLRNRLLCIFTWGPNTLPSLLASPCVSERPMSRSSLALWEPCRFKPTWTL